MAAGNLSALAWLLAVSVALARIDLRDQRLPTPWICTLAVGLVAIHWIAVLAGGGPERLGWAMVGGPAFRGLLGVLHRSSPPSLAWGR